MNDTLIQNAWKALRLFDKKKSLWVLSLSFINAILEFFSVAAFLPVMALIVNPNVVGTNVFVNRLYTHFQFTSHASFVIVTTIGVLVFLIVKNILSISIAKIKSNYAFSIGKELSSSALLQYLQMSYIQFSQADFTKELNRITNYPFAFANNIIIPMSNLFTEALVCLLLLTGIAFYDYKIFLILCIILLPVIALYQLRKKSLKDINDDLKQKYPLLLKNALRVIEGFTEIVSHRKQSFFYKRFQKTNEALTQAFVQDQVLQASTIRITEVIVGALICLLVVYSVTTRQTYENTLLLLGLYVGASFKLLPSVNKILHALQQMRVHEHLFEELKIYKTSTTKELSTHNQANQFKEIIALKSISFTYPNGITALYKSSLAIRKGEKVAITGKSGEGKTTVLLLLLRLLKETEGQFLVDGEPVHDEDAWRRYIGYVPQNPYILDGSILENVAFGIPPEDVDRQKVVRLLDDLELTDLVSQSTEGIDSNIGERGVKLSGGQRQRLALARALYAEADILVLDEITNQVHNALEIDIWNILDELSKQGKTIIMVTHKLPHTNFFNSIYNLEKGHLSEVSVQLHG